MKILSQMAVVALAVLAAGYFFGNWGFGFAVAGMAIHFVRETFLSGGREYEETERWTDGAGRHRVRKSKGKELKYPQARQIATYAMFTFYFLALVIGAVHWDTRTQPQVPGWLESISQQTRSGGVIPSAAPEGAAGLTIDLNAGEEKRAIDVVPGVTTRIYTNRPITVYSRANEDGSKGDEFNYSPGVSYWTGVKRPGYLVVRGLRDDTEVEFIRQD